MEQPPNLCAAPCKGLGWEAFKTKMGARGLEPPNLCAAPCKGSDGKRLKQKWALEDSNLRTSRM